MKYVIDTSALINIVLKFYKKDINFINRLVEESIFPDLIFYEIGSYLRKYKKITKISNNEIKEIAELFNYIIEKAKIDEVRLNYEILDLSIKENLSYYDAVYLYLARKYNLILISDDTDLIEKGAISSDNLLRNFK
ncbi:MAG: PIN domain-containing protein [Nanoarchaeota archaeon]|jgi:predicted nucleic acid-binding protein|nr:PIN domain-containing protein [Nanoarchaeota archaeon]